MNSTTEKAPAVYEALDSPDLRFDATRVDPGGFPEVISAAFLAVGLPRIAAGFGRRVTQAGPDVAFSQLD